MNNFLQIGQLFVQSGFTTEQISKLERAAYKFKVDNDQELVNAHDVFNRMKIDTTSIEYIQIKQEVDVYAFESLQSQLRIMTGTAYEILFYLKCAYLAINTRSEESFTLGHSKEEYVLMIMDEYNRRSDVLKYAYQEGDLFGHIPSNTPQVLSSETDGNTDEAINKIDKNNPYKQL